MKIIIIWFSVFLVLFLFSCEEEKVTSEITYPETVSGAINVLNEKDTVFLEGFDTNYCFHAVTPEGMSLKVKMEFIGGGDLSYGYWGYNLSSKINWGITTYDTKNFQYFTVTESGKPSNLEMLFLSGNGVKIRISYFENSDLVVSRTKIITVN